MSTSELFKFPDEIHTPDCNQTWRRTLCLRSRVKIVTFFLQQREERKDVRLQNRKLLGSQQQPNEEEDYPKEIRLSEFQFRLVRLGVGVFRVRGLLPVELVQLHLHRLQRGLRLERRPLLQTEAAAAEEEEEPESVEVSGRSVRVGLQKETQKGSGNEEEKSKQQKRTDRKESQIEPEMLRLLRLSRTSHRISFLYRMLFFIPTCRVLFYCIFLSVSFVFGCF